MSAADAGDAPVAAPVPGAGGSVLGEVDVRLVARVAEAASLTLELDELLERVRDLMVPGLADLVGIHLPTPGGLARYLPPYASPAPPQPRRGGLARRMLLDTAMPFDEELPAVRAFRTGRTVLVDAVAAPPQIPDVARGVQRGWVCGAAVPLVVGGQVLGILGLARQAGRPQLTPAEVELAERVAARIAVAVAHAQRLDRERSNAEILQRALLPADLPPVPGLEVAVRYIPGTHDLEVGGDWYDVIPHAAGGVGLVIGDVMGRGIRAAAVMGQVRAALRAYARLDLPPARTLALLDELVRDLDDTAIVTALYAVLDPAARTMTYARAGHPPPVVVAPSGCGRTLEGPVSPPLGTGGAQEDTTVSLPAGALLALYTDGLVEDRCNDIDTGLEALVQALAAGPAALEQLADHALDRLGRGEGHDDDIALLLVRLSG